MAKKDDIESDITLELDGHVSPSQMAKALNALSALLNSGHKKLDPDKAMQWTIQVKKGSNLVGFYPATTPANPAVINNIQIGLRQLEQGIEKPDGFSDAMLHNLHTLCDVQKTKKQRNTIVRLWLNKEASNITKKMKNNLEIVLAGEFEEFGSIEGRLQTLNAHDSYEFAIYEPLHNKKIVCHVTNEQIFSEAYKLFERRVEAEGLIKYDVNGIPYEIEVERFNLLPSPPNILNYKSTRGILKAYV